MTEGTDVGGDLPGLFRRGQLLVAFGVMSKHEFAEVTMSFAVHNVPEARCAPGHFLAVVASWIVGTPRVRARELVGLEAPPIAALAFRADEILASRQVTMHERRSAARMGDLVVDAASKVTVAVQAAAAGMALSRALAFYCVVSASEPADVLGGQLAL